MSRTVLLALVTILGTACGRTAPAPSASAGDAAQAPTESDTSPISKGSVTLYFPSASGDRLVAQTREIIETPRPADRGAQILTALLDGPEGGDALPLAPEGTTLHRLWVRPDGTAYADFSDDLVRGLTGSADEILTLYAIVDSLALNVPEIKRVAVLVDGRERDTLAGHIDTRRPLPPDSTLIATAQAKE